MSRLFRSVFLSVMLLVMALPAFGEGRRAAEGRSAEATVAILDELLAQSEPADEPVGAIEITSVRLEETEARVI